MGMNQFFRGMFTPGIGSQVSPAQQAGPMSMPQIQQNLMAGQRESELAQALMNSGYVQNSGPWGALAQIASSFSGHKLAKSGDQKIADALEQRFKLENEAKQAEFVKTQEAEKAKFNSERQQRLADAEAMGLQGKDAQKYAVTGKIPEAAKMKFTNGFFVNEQTGEVQRNDEYLNAQAQLKAAGRAPAQPRAPSAIQERIALAQEMGATPEQLRSIVIPERPLNAQEVKQQQSNVVKEQSINNALDIIGKLEKMTSQGIGGPLAASGWNPFTNRMTDAGQAIEQYDGLSSALVDELTRVQRVPGIGAQSNAELENILRMIPTANKSESTRAALLEQIKKKLVGLNSGYGFDTQQAQPQSGGWSIQKVQ